MTNKEIEIYVAKSETDFYIQARDLVKKRKFAGITGTPALLIPEQGEKAKLWERILYYQDLNKRIFDGKLITRYLFSLQKTVEAINPSLPEYEGLKSSWRKIAEKENLQIRSYGEETKIESGIIAVYKDKKDKIVVLMRRKPEDPDFNYKDYISKVNGFFEKKGKRSNLKENSNVIENLISEIESKNNINYIKYKTDSGVSTKV